MSLLTQGGVKLRFDAVRFETNVTVFAQYNNVTIENEASNFTLRLGTWDNTSTMGTCISPWEREREVCVSYHRADDV
jgi:hypothetical protein